MAFHRNGLHFREVEEFDLEWLRALRNDPRSTPGWRDPRSVQTMHNQEEWLKTLNNLNQAFVVGDGNERVGLLRFRLDYAMSEARMTGTDVMPEMTGQGYGRRILHAGAHYVIQDLGFHRVTAECLDTNVAAAAIIRNAGFKPEGTLRGYVWREGAWRNWHIFSLLREDL